eukprot:1022970-Pelagomonas_calceolata.AAC.3
MKCSKKVDLIEDGTEKHTTHIWLLDVAAGALTHNSSACGLWRWQHATVHICSSGGGSWGHDVQQFDMQLLEVVAFNSSKIRLMEMATWQHTKVYTFASWRWQLGPPHTTFQYVAFGGQGVLFERGNQNSYSSTSKHTSALPPALCAFKPSGRSAEWFWWHLAEGDPGRPPKMDENMAMHAAYLEVQQSGLQGIGLRVIQAKKEEKRQNGLHGPHLKVQ